MKGKNVFTTEEAAELRALIAKLQYATRDEKKKDSQPNAGNRILCI